MDIREQKPEDAAILLQLFHDTVHNINIRDYNQEQVQAWAPEKFDLEKWQARTLNYKIFVAEDDKGIAGFAELEANGHIDCFYVHHQRQGQGVGHLLIDRVEQEALSMSLPRLYADVSLTAKAFFERAGFSSLAEQEVEIRGQKLTNFKMEKQL